MTTGIYRREGGYQAVIGRKGPSRFFADGRYGGPERSEQAARQWRERERRRHFGHNRPHRARDGVRDGRVIGVTLRINAHGRAAWRAVGIGEANRYLVSFSVIEHGYAEAYRLAVQARWRAIGRPYTKAELAALVPPPAPEGLRVRSRKGGPVPGVALNAHMTKAGYPNVRWRAYAAGGDSYTTVSVARHGYAGAYREAVRRRYRALGRRYTLAELAELQPPPPPQWLRTLRPHWFEEEE